MHGGPIGGRHVLPIFTLASTLLAGAPCGSLWGLGSSLRLVLFPSLVFSFVACSLANCIILQTIILQTVPFCKLYHLVSNLWLVLPFVAVDC